jgi:hypothetical protein
LARARDGKIQNDKGVLADAFFFGNPFNAGRASLDIQKQVGSGCGKFMFAKRTEAWFFYVNKERNFMKNRWLMATFMAAVLTLSSGCALLVVGGVAAGAGAGTYAYVNGELKETEGVSYDTAYNATLAAMNDLQYAVESKPKDAITATITARTTTDKKIVVTLNKQSATATEIRIRVGTFGDENLSRQALDKIKSHF